MDILSAIQKRYATKIFDKQQSLSEVQINQLNEVLRLSASSLNVQPWRFIAAKTTEQKERVATACPGEMNYNAKKIKEASYVVVLCTKITWTEADVHQIIEQEDKDGRYTTEQAKKDRKLLTMGYLKHKQSEPEKMQAWLKNQVYIALGCVLTASAAMEIDSVAIEGFDSELLDKEYQLEELGLKSLVVVAFGAADATDFNAKLPKSRLSHETVFLDIK